MKEFPFIRMRRLRKKEFLRDLVRETVLTPDDLVYPLFVIKGEGKKEEISSMPGQYRYSIDVLCEEIQKIKEEGIKAVILFGIPEKKDEMGSDSYSDDGIIQRALREIRKFEKDIILITDLCMCEYTSHGHCGIIKNGDVDNDTTLEYLGKIAVSQVVAGADIVAPSGMMDGMVKAIRKALDESGFKDTPILSYAVKYASSFYGPFREAAESAPQFGNRKTYQMDPANLREAILEAELDYEEGADILMVKPALAYLDVIKTIRERFNRPIAAYNVSGEYAMVKAASMKGYINERDVVLEILTSIKRAGADIILTYHARDVVKWLKGG
ncbi:MAG: porphobilinogen synthase [candidate division WOR-3 bacterium]